MLFQLSWLTTIILFPVFLALTTSLFDKVQEKNIRSYALGVVVAYFFVTITEKWKYFEVDNGRQFQFLENYYSILEIASNWLFKLHHTSIVLIIIGSLIIPLVILTLFSKFENRQTLKGEILKKMTVAEVMNPHPVTVFDDTLMSDILIIMTVLKVECIVVIKVNSSGFCQPINLIHYKDLIQLEKEQENLNSIEAKIGTRSRKYFIKEHDSLWKVEQKMSQLEVSCLIVVGNNRELVGTISRSKIDQLESKK